VKRATVVAAASMAGLTGVVAFHTKVAPLSLGVRVVSPGAATSPTTALSPATTAPSAATTAPAGTATQAPSAIGAAVNYNYGVLSVSVTVQRTKLTNVTIAPIYDGGNFRSQSMDQQATPVLEQEERQAQSANIQRASAANYTGAGFHQSLQSALTQLGLR